MKLGRTKIRKAQEKKGVGGSFHFCSGGQWGERTDGGWRGKIICYKKPNNNLFHFVGPLFVEEKIQEWT